MAGLALSPVSSHWLVALLLLLSAEPVPAAKPEDLYPNSKGFSTLAQLKQRNTLKDGIIMIQTLLIILFIIVPIFLLLDKDDSKAGMEEDHTYEGLDIDQTATYEDIVTLRTGEVKWSVGEHPGQE
ncbi:B-cell antigen receptor complex-associated protein beta chain isoform X4 [Papio anubis]|uniref:CD79b molecule n=4 Tax=Cercopithecinae TaxID=9528 RepID=A0A2K5NCE2_CERAT|nr:PREDICTED: B-cell antigen receptor complex-associated protein beta chain isoform X3 [Mandrillus leucophaeus]XP_011926009.1 PREDICTED: B-cell antigen receptor complex-associated protein beta chain isoform X3 [Cercocebus atys]XP_021784104.1 B-cell antigen receptor complex-associated protein beta chain isoform X4 [Papio anubis]XP_025217592.1 B-cell antigen receptor complex-associated protein beta chain isoform X4 [Theropithecus gelada]